MRRLINGHAGYQPIPIVWGISATIQRFDDGDEGGRRHQEPAIAAEGARRPRARPGVRAREGHDRADIPAEGASSTPSSSDGRP